MSDLIERLAAIDAIRASTKKYTGFMEMEMYTDDDAVEAIISLPSAQPEKRTQERTETHACDCISRKEAIDAFLTELTKRERKNLLHTWSTVEVKYFVVEMLEQMSSAQPVAKDINVPCTDTQPKNENEPLKTDQNAPLEGFISRKKAIEAFDNLEWFHQNANKDMVSGANSAEHQAWYKADDVYRVLEQLPYAQPEHTNSCYTNSWCIDCKEYDTENKCCPRYNRVIKQTLDEIYLHAETEAAARFHAEIVRCKECVYWVAHDKRCVYLNHGFAPNMWCCHGRRTDEKENI